MKKVASILAFIILCFTKCNKENDLIILSGTYLSGTTAKVSPVYMYTQNGQITDTSFIRQYLIGLNYSDTFFSFRNEPVSIAPNVNIKLEFEGDNVFRTNLNFNAVREPCKIESKSSSLITIALKDSSEYFSSSSTITIPRSRCDTLIESLMLPKIPKIFYPTYGGSGIVRYLLKFVIENNNGLLTYPLMTYSTRSVKPTGYYCYNTGKLWLFSSIFDSTIQGKLESGDTIVYQLTYVPLIKQ